MEVSKIRSLSNFGFPTTTSSKSLIFFTLKTRINLTQNSKTPKNIIKVLILNEIILINSDEIHAIRTT